MSNITQRLLVLSGMTSDRNTVLKFCEPKGTPRHTLFDRLLENAKQILGSNGVFVLNLVGEVDECTAYVETIRQIFDSPIVIAMKRGGNLVVFAGNALLDPRHVPLRLSKAQRVNDRLGLFFPTLIQHLHESHQQLALQSAAMRMNNSQTHAIPHGDWFVTAGNRLPPPFALKRDLLALQVAATAFP